MGKKHKGNTLLGWGGFLLAALFLTACSGSSGGGGTGGITVSGKVIDNSIPNPTMTITTRSPGASGTTIGNGISDSSGDYTERIITPDDNMCEVDIQVNPTSSQDSWEMAQRIAGQASSNSSSNLLHSAAANSPSCTHIENDLDLVSESPDWIPEIGGGEDVSTPIPVTPGSYTLQGVLEESGVSSDGSANNTPLIEPFSATISVDAIGNLTMGTTTTSLNISGISHAQVLGQSISMVLTDNSHLDFTITGTILPLDSSWLTNGSGFSIRAGGTGPSSQAVRVDAVLVSSGAQPLWGNFKPSDQ
ncbi:MAG: hypothetical protein ACYCYP_05330 [Leptospirales bacterium]